MAFDQSCIKLDPNGRSIDVPELECNHEEADTRMLLHAKDISNPDFSNIVIHTPDTDVFLISLGLSVQIRSNLFIRTGTNIARIISIEKVRASLAMRFEVHDTESICQALLGLHAFTGYDSISPFSGKGKTKPVKVMMKKAEYVNLFSSFGNDPAVQKINISGFSILFAICMDTRKNALIL